MPCSERDKLLLRRILIAVRNFIIILNILRESFRLVFVLCLCLTQKSNNLILKIFTTMDSLMRNPGYSCIARKILWFLDHQDQMACRLVSPPWKAHMDQPSFWIKKCDQRGQSIELHDAWIDLVQRIEEGH